MGLLFRKPTTMNFKTFASMAVVIGLMACAPKTSQNYNQADINEIVKTLSHDDMAGRAAGEAGGEAARDYILNLVKTSNAFDGHRIMPFEFIARSKNSKTGRNIVAWRDGKTTPSDESGPVFIITAHYDHLGVHEGEIYNGADDNASGVAALFAIAESFAGLPSNHDIVFVWLDAEESGLAGAREFVKANPDLMSRPVLNLNLDMISRNQDGVLFMAGGYHTPDLIPLVEQAAMGTDVTLKFGHDRPEDKGNDWTLQSDHGEFHKVGLPFVYFGVEDHPHYHRPTDDFETLPLERYADYVKLIVNAAHILDENLEDVAKPAAKTE